MGMISHLVPKRVRAALVNQPPQIEGLQFVEFGGNNRFVPPGKVEGQLTVGRYSTIGEYGQFFGTVSVGRYCQIAPFCAVYGLDHPYGHMTNYVNRMLFEGRMKAHQEAGVVEIGNDVWMGHGVVVLKSVTIESGAIVGAGSVVTRALQPFAIAVGNPARQIGQRFSDEVCDLILRIGWWNMAPDELIRWEDVFHVDFRSHPGLAVELLTDWLAELTA